MAAQNRIANPASDELPGEGPSRKPVCLFWFAESYKHWSSLSTQLQSLGMEAQLITSETELHERLTAHGRTFAVFGDFEFLPTLLKARLTLGPSSRVKWNIMAPQLRSDVKEKFFRCGFSGIMQRPAHPFSFQSHCKIQLSHFINQLGAGHEIEVPEWLNRNNNHGTINFISRASEAESTSDSKFKVMRGEKKIEVAHNKIFFLDPAANKMEPGRVEDLLEAYHALSANDANFVKVQGSENLRSFFAEIESDHSVVTLWTKQCGYSCQLKLVDFDSHLGRITLAAEEGEAAEVAERLLSTSTNNRIYLCSLTQRGRVFSCALATTLKRDGQHLSLKIEDALYKVQRRKEFRYSFLPHEVFYAEASVGAESFRFVIKDLSASGICIVGSAKLAHYLRNYTSDVNISFRLGEDHFKFMARYVFSTPSEEPEIAFKYLNADPVEATKVRLFVYEKSFEYLDRFVL